MLAAGHGRPPPGRENAPTAREGGPALEALSVLLRFGLALVLLTVPAPASAQEAQRSRSVGTGDTLLAANGDTVAFRHGDHADVGCQRCHSSEDTHGAVTVTSIRGCRSCHHSEPTARPCTRCHDRSELERSGEHPVTRDLALSVGTARDRELPFDHGIHGSVDCADCHAGGTSRSAATIQCSECHDEHHGTEVRCASCHREAPEGTHPLAAHATCTGSGCHDAQSLPVTASTMARAPRSICLACHQDQEDHRPGEQCARCHLTPSDAGSGDR